MKLALSLIALAAAFVTSSANASGLATEVMNCHGGMGEATGSFRLLHVSTSAPGGPVSEAYYASASAAWLNGTHASGDVRVTAIPAQDGGPTTYVNEAAGFAVTVERVQTNPEGRIVKAVISGNFLDPRTGMHGHVIRQVYTCN